MSSDQFVEETAPVRTAAERQFVKLNAKWRIAAVAGVVFVVDQLSKLIVLSYLQYAQEKTVLEGFFKFVHWGNTGAAYSMFYGNNGVLAVVALAALIVLFLVRRHFEADRLPGQISLGLIFGGILGNLTDRLLRGHVIDFLYFYLIRRDGKEAGFPAFNVADSAICIGVGLLFLISWRSDAEGNERSSRQPPPNPSP